MHQSTICCSVMFTCQRRSQLGYKLTLTLSMSGVRLWVEEILSDIFVCSWDIVSGMKRGSSAAPSILSFQQTVQFAVAVTCSCIIWQCGIWLKSSCDICVFHRRSLVLKVLPVAHISVIIRLCPWSCRLRAFRWLMMSHTNFLFRSSVSAFHELTDSLTQLEKSFQHLSLA